MDVTSLINKASPEEIQAAILSLTNSGDPDCLDDLAVFLTARDNHTYLKQEIPRWAAAAHIQIGPTGVRRLGELLLTAPGTIYPHAIIEAIWQAAQSRRSNSPFSHRMPPEFSAPIGDETSHEAKSVLNEILQNARLNPDLFSILLRFLSEQATFGSILSGDDEHQIVESIYDAFTAGSIRISKRLIHQFESLIQQERPEEEYQQFLQAHPVFLDPLAATVIAKQRLGVEFVTDFVLNRHDGKYILVEIEKPHDTIFTQQDDFSAKFTHAFGQVLDFQQWIDTHGEYARSLLPGISSPRGLLVMGLRSKLTQRHIEKLHRFSLNAAMVNVLTFDDLVENSRNLYRSIVRVHNDTGATAS